MSGASPAMSDAVVVGRKLGKMMPWLEAKEPPK
jgi:hypothetical protein